MVYPTDPSKIKGREFSRSLYVAEDVKTSDVVTEKNIRSVRPGYGLHPKYLPEMLGKIREGLADGREVLVRNGQMKMATLISSGSRTDTCCV